MKFKIRTEDEEVVFEVKHESQAATAEDVAKAYAEDQFERHELHSPSCWPISYDIFFEGKWVKVSVEMEYIPCFTAREEQA